MQIAILGPTASGKSALAVAVARKMGGTVVNGDPFQAIQGLAVGTGQPSPAEQEGVLHLGYGLLPPSSRPNPAAFGAAVQGWMAPLENLVLVTGSGLYLRGIWNQLSELPEVDAAVVQRLRRLMTALGPPRMHRYLRAVDPGRAGELHPNDRARIQRALALHFATGRPAAALLTGIAPPPSEWRTLVVQPSRKRQRDRVAARVAWQLRHGWPEEARRLQTDGFGPDLAVLRPLGYDLLLQGGKDAEARIVQLTQAYAKRQSTWFRNQFGGSAAWDPDVEPLETAFEKLGL